MHKLYTCILSTHDSRSPKVGNPVASILQSNVEGIPALNVTNPASNFCVFTVYPCNPSARKFTGVPSILLLVDVGLMTWTSC